MIFPAGKKISIHEVLKRSAAFLAEYENWKYGDTSKSVFLSLQKAFYFKQGGMQPEIDMDIYTSAYSNGITVYPGKKGDMPLAMIMEHIKNELLLLGYRLVNADRRITDKGDSIQTIERYYCKPPISMEMPIDQYFGNIIIELFLTDRKPFRLKMMANIYADRLYDSPREFQDLINFLFGTERI